MAGNVHNLRPPWPKGVSGNPGALSKEVRARHMEVRELAATFSVEAIHKLRDLLSCGVPAVEKSAADSILDRAGIKAIALDVQQVETDENGSVKTVRVEFVSPNAG